MAQDKRLQFINLMTRSKGLTLEQHTRINAIIANNVGVGFASKGSKLKHVNASPLSTAMFLSGFNDPFKFKYLTHDFDIRGDGRPESWDAVIKQVQDIMGNKETNLEIPTSLKKLLDAFINKGKWLDTYNNQHISFAKNVTWCNWSKENGLHPLNNPDFQKELMDFRSTTRVVPPLLEEICKHASENSKLNIVTEKLNSADFYTNTFILNSAIRRILAMMDERSASFPDVHISFKRDFDDDGRMLRKIYITQLGSYSENELVDVEKRLKSYEEKGDLGAIKQLLSGYCYWSIEAFWAGKAGRLNVLKSSETQGKEEIPSDQVKGFTHILTYYLV